MVADLGRYTQLLETVSLYLLHVLSWLMADLSGARAKLERANQHIRDLAAQQGIFLSDNPYTTVPQYQSERNVTAYFLKSMKPVPPVIPLIAGDIVHNLRTALDYVAFGLVPAGLPTRDLYF